jgi:hypothetical protein
MTVELSPDVPKGWQTPRAKTLLLAAIGLMYVYVFVTTESFLFDKSHPTWAHIEPLLTSPANRRVVAPAHTPGMTQWRNA